MASAAALLAGCGEAAPSEDPPDTAPAVTTPASESAAAPAAPSAPTDAAAPVPDASGLDGAALHGVAGTGGGLVAVGAHDGAAAWTSTDGTTWQPARVRGGDATPQLRAVAIAPSSGLALGGDDLRSSRVWTSSDGTTWRRRAGATVADGRVNGLATDGERWIAVGDLIDREGGGSRGGAIWTSRNGRSWRVADELKLGEGTVSDVAVGDGMVIVVGFDVDGGRVWTGDPADLRPVRDRDFAAAEVQGVAAADTGFVALGRALGTMQPIAWTSSDGSDWERAELDDAVFPPEDQINDLTWVDGRLVAVGASPDGGLVWTSADGRTWTRQP